jgi:hypothetical protein
MAALRQLGAEVEPVLHQDDALESVRGQLLGLDGVLVWVNPVQDGLNRWHLDGVLREVAAKGVWVSAHPEVILALGTKEVLYRTRDVGWGTDTDLYRDAIDFRARFPRALAKDKVRVLKQARGNGGNGVWKVELVESPAPSADGPGPDTEVRVRHAREQEKAQWEQLRLGDFLDRCEEYFAWSGCLIDQPYQERLADGLIRCYFVYDEVVGFRHQWPRGLLEPSTEAARQPAPPSVCDDPETPAYRLLRQSVEQWIPRMQQVLGLQTAALPAIWDADFLYGPKLPAGEDTYVLCEINVSAVWPFPEQAVETLARAAVASIASRQR